MKLDDQQLDELLKAVAVPTDLAARLRATLDEATAFPSPGDPTTQAVVQTPSLAVANSDLDLNTPRPGSLAADKSGRLPWVIALATSLLLLLGGALAWKLNVFERQPEQPLLVDTKSLSPNPLIPSPSPPRESREQGFGIGTNSTERTAPAESSANMLLAQLERHLQKEKATMLALETQDLQRQVEQAEKELARLRMQPRFSDTSLTLAFVAESSLKAGNAQTVVKEDLQLVIDRFPDSAGAVLAEKLLAKMN
jgi:hypothetical protein